MSTRSRRGHQSTKIPNVKLRPSLSTAQPSIAVRNAGSRLQEGAAEGDEERARGMEGLSEMDKARIRQLDQEDGLVDANPDDHDLELRHAMTSKPFSRISVTFTSLDPNERDDLLKKAQTMGLWRFDRALMADTTAVVGRDTSSAKYKGAVQHRKPVFEPSWITSSYERWLGGEDIGDVLSLHEYRLKPFYGLKIALTGIEPNRTCTHLVVPHTMNISSTESSQLSPKIAFAIRVNEDQHRIAIVWEGWIWDCVTLAARYPTERWDLQKNDKPPPEDETETLKEQARQAAEARTVIEAALRSSPVQEPEDVPELEQAKLRKRPSAGRMLRAASGLDSVDQMLQDMVQDIAPQPIAGPSTRRFADDKSEAPSKRQKSSVSANTGHASFLHRSRQFDTGPPPPTSASVANTDASTIPDPNLFAGKSFAIRIPDCVTDKLVEAIRANGGLIAEDDVDYLVVKLGSPTPSHLPKAVHTVTECWVERCIFDKEIHSLDSHIAFRPLEKPMPVPGAEVIRISCSGLSMEEHHFTRRLVKAIGAEFAREMSRKHTTHLISAHTNGLKIRKAAEWNIPVVELGWLHETARAGSIQPLESYRKHLETDTGARPLASNAELSVIVAQPSMFGLDNEPEKEARDNRAKLTSSTLIEGQSRKYTLAPADTNILGRRSLSVDGSQDKPTEATLSVPSAPDVTEGKSSSFAKSHSEPSLKSAPKPTIALPVSVDVTNILTELATAENAVANPPQEALPPRVARRLRSALRPKPETHEAATPLQPDTEESFRVMYADPAADRERRRLLEGFEESNKRTPRRTKRL